MNETRKTNPHRHRQQYSGYRREGGDIMKRKGDQVHGDGRCFDFWVVGAHCNIQIIYDRNIHLKTI